MTAAFSYQFSGCSSLVWQQENSDFTCLMMELVSAGWKTGLFVAWEDSEESILGTKQNIS